MNSYQKQAWECLLGEEQMAITLSLTHGKSTWQAGEIMGKAHYKFLEINQRGQKFFKLFAEYYQLYNKLIPTRSTISPDFKKYITLLMEKRKPLVDVVKEINSEIYNNPKQRDKDILKNIHTLKNSGITQENNFYHLIMDFDRWNNFRVMPIDIQEPSAFKRRNKHKLRKLVNLFISLHPFAILKLKQLYEVKDDRKVKEYCFLPLITIHDPSVTEIIRIPQNEKNIREMNKLTLFLFSFEYDAKEFINILEGYVFKETKHCRDGQQFWPEFRVLTKKAINHDYLLNITPNRKFVLDNAQADRDTQWFITKKRAKEDKDLAASINRRIEKAQKSRVLEKQKK